MATRTPPTPPRRHPLDRAKSALDLLLYRVGLRGLRFRGAFDTHASALAAVRPGRLAGYDNEVIADVSFERMCRIELWDWPVLYWLWRLNSPSGALLDLGGHQGTKFRAFRNHLELSENFRWVVYDVPAVVRAGRERAVREGLSNLTFLDDLAESPAVDLALASGLLQYLDRPFEQLLRRLPTLPAHLILNKVATRGGPAVVTLENFGRAEVPYQIRNYEEFAASLESLGYEIVDQWQIPELSHVIPTNPGLGASTSIGIYARLRGNCAAS